jgi:EpsD family peptidyl-prolyl cis-trans isomerase
MGTRHAIGMRRTLCVAAILACAGCGRDQSDQAVALAGEQQVLAKVNGSSITRYDVDAAAQRTLGEELALSLDATGRRKVLESLVQSRAVAQLAERELAAEERAALDKRVSAYREELLVQAYLERHITPSPVTGQMVRQYYEAHPERFGGKKVVSYEMLFTPNAPAGKAREGLLQALRKSAQVKDLAAFGEELKKAGHDVLYRRGSVAEQTLDPQLRAALQQLAVGKTSNVIMLGGRLHVARIASESVQAARPLEQVADEIRRTLSPLRVKEAVKSASREALKKAKVVYQDEATRAGS